jgi:hypothetical protein
VQEIREQATGSQESKEPSGASLKTGGTVQPTDVPLPAPNPLRAQPEFAVT